MQMLDLELGNLSVILKTIFYFIVVPSVVAGWFIWRRFTATADTVARVDVEQTARRTNRRTSAPSSVIANDQVSRDWQDDQVSQDGQDALANQRISIASSVEVLRGGENQQQAPRVKQENRVLPGTSRQVNLWSYVHTPILAERSQIRRQPVGLTETRPSPLNLPQFNVNFNQDLNRNQVQTYHSDAISENRVEAEKWRRGVQ